MKVAITHLAMEIDFQTYDHIVAIVKAAEPSIKKYSICNSFKVMHDFINYGR